MNVVASYPEPLSNMVRATNFPEYLEELFEKNCKAYVSISEMPATVLLFRVVDADESLVNVYMAQITSEHELDAFRDELFTLYKRFPFQMLPEKKGC